MTEPANQPIEVREQYFWRGPKRFLIRGVVYQLEGSDPQRGPWSSPKDPIIDERLSRLETDVALFKELGVNTLYVYSIDNTKEHGRAMKMLEQAGIYVFCTLTTNERGINRFDPVGSYDIVNMQHFFKTADEMIKYPNTLGLMVANELIDNKENMSCAPVLRAVVRDLKNYMKLKHGATRRGILPLGYDASMNRTLLVGTLDYLSSGDTESRVDFVACKGYEWVGSHSSIKMSGWKNLMDQFQHLPVPVFFSEYGTITFPDDVSSVNDLRQFTETEALFSSEMTHVMSGGCVYEFWCGSNAYGIVKMLSVEEEKKEKEAATMSEEAFRDKWSEFRSIKGAVVERRETPWGTLLLYADFFNYKERLAATRDTEPNTLSSPVDREHHERELASIRVREHRFIGEIGEVPESCIDWTQIGVA